MAVSKTSRFSLTRWDSGGDPYNRALHDGDNVQIETLGAVWREGDDPAKGLASAASNARSFFYAKDLDILYWSNGTNWVTLNDYAEATDIQPLRTGSPASAGSVTTTSGVSYLEFALANHVHPMGTPATPASVGTSNSAGTTSEAVFAAEDHVHRLGAGSIDGTTLFGVSVVPSTAIVDLAVTTQKLGNLAVTTAKIDDAAVTTAKIGALAVAEANLANGSVATAKIAAGAVVEAGLADLAVTTGKLANSAVTSAKIADGTITGTDIASATITGANVASATIAGSNIASATITGSNIASGTVTSANILDGTITGTDIASGTITSSNIQDGTITLADLASTLQNLLVPVLSVSATASATAPAGWFFFNQTIINAQALYPTAWASAPAAWKSGSNLILPEVNDAVIAQFAATALGSVGGSNTSTIAASNLPPHQHATDHSHNGSTTGDQSQDHVHNASHGHGSSISLQPNDTDLVTRLTSIANGVFVTGTAADLGGTWVMAMNSGLAAPLVGMAVHWIDNHTHAASVTVNDAIFNTLGVSQGHAHATPSLSFSGNSGNGPGTSAALSVRNKHLALNLMIKIH